MAALPMPTSEGELTEDSEAPPKIATSQETRSHQQDATAEQRAGGEQPDATDVPRPERERSDSAPRRRYTIEHLLALRPHESEALNDGRVRGTHCAVRELELQLVNMDVRNATEQRAAVEEPADTVSSRPEQEHSDSVANRRYPVSRHEAASHCVPQRICVPQRSCCDSDSERNRSPEQLLSLRSRYMEPLDLPKLPPPDLPSLTPQRQRLPEPTTPLTADLPSHPALDLPKLPPPQVMQTDHQTRWRPAADLPEWSIPTPELSSGPPKYSEVWGVQMAGALEKLLNLPPPMSTQPNKQESRRARTPCRYGEGCTRRDCWFSHPEGDQRYGLNRPAKKQSVGLPAHDPIAQKLSEISRKQVRQCWNMLVDGMVDAGVYYSHTFLGKNWLAGGKAMEVTLERDGLCDKLVTKPHSRQRATEREILGKALGLLQTKAPAYGVQALYDEVLKLVVGEPIQPNSSEPGPGCASCNARTGETGGSSPGPSTSQDEFVDQALSRWLEDAGNYDTDTTRRCHSMNYLWASRKRYQGDGQLPKPEDLQRMKDAGIWVPWTVQNRFVREMLCGKKYEHVGVPEPWLEKSEFQKRMEHGRRDPTQQLKRKSDLILNKISPGNYQKLMVHLRQVMHAFVFRVEDLYTVVKDLFEHARVDRSQLKEYAQNGNQMRRLYADMASELAEFIPRRLANQDPEELHQVVLRLIEHCCLLQITDHVPYCVEFTAWLFKRHLVDESLIHEHLIPRLMVHPVPEYMAAVCLLLEICGADLDSYQANLYITQLEELAPRCGKRIIFRIEDLWKHPSERRFSRGRIPKPVHVGLDPKKLEETYNERVGLQYGYELQTRDLFVDWSGEPTWDKALEREFHSWKHSLGPAPYDMTATTMEEFCEWLRQGDEPRELNDDEIRFCGCAIGVLKGTRRTLNAKLFGRDIEWRARLTEELLSGHFTAEDICMKNGLQFILFAKRLLEFKFKKKATKIYKACKKFLNTCQENYVKAMKAAACLRCRTPVQTVQGSGAQDGEVPQDESSQQTGESAQGSSEPVSEEPQPLNGETLAEEPQPPEHLYYQPDAQSAEPESEEEPESREQPCRFGDACHREDCYYQHPSGVERWALCPIPVEKFKLNYLSEEEMALPRALLSVIRRELKSCEAQAKAGSNGESALETILNAQMPRDAYYTEVDLHDIWRQVSDEMRQECPVKDCKDCANFGVPHYPRGLSGPSATPDVLFKRPCRIGPNPVRWIDSKAGVIMKRGVSHNVMYKKTLQQMRKYCEQFGPGVILWHSGFSHSMMSEVPGVVHYSCAPITVYKSEEAEEEDPFPEVEAVETFVPPRLRETFVPEIFTPPAEREPEKQSNAELPPALTFVEMPSFRPVSDAELPPDVEDWMCPDGFD